ncbi:hypothetical protein OAS39_06110 [Pirellulales bacterium]|nr:hypothetical protein [Pirellulales bacterium]
MISWVREQLKSREFIGAAGLLTLLTLVMFIDLFWSGGRIVSAAGTDLDTQFSAWLQFGFDEMSQGNVPLWNPHAFSGTPFLATFQPALFYPPNIAFLLLPFSLAINASMAMHILWLGLGQLLWGRYQGLSIPGALVSAAIVMFGGACFLHLYAGHVSLIWAVSWAPLVLLSANAVVRDGSRSWALLGALAVAMQILAGHPQTVYFTAIAAGLLAVAEASGAAGRWSRLLYVAAIFVGAALLGAIQLLPGLHVALESSRSGGTPFEFAATFSLPPANLVTMFAPTFFGDQGAVPYWGAWYHWEASPYCGAAALCLACLAVLRTSTRRERWKIAIVFVLLFVVALGAYTPVGRWLYDLVPAYDRFRGSAKMTAQAMMFFALLAGMAVDDLRNAVVQLVWPMRVALAAGAILLVAGTAIGFSADDASVWWNRAVQSAGEERSPLNYSYLPESNYVDPEFAAAAGRCAAISLVVAGLVFIAASAGWFWSTRHRNAWWIVPALAVAEVFCWARFYRATYKPNDEFRQQLAEFVEENPGDHRILVARPNEAMRVGARDIWGYDPVNLQRYVKFMAVSQGIEGDDNTILSLRRADRMWRLLRCRYVISERDGQLQSTEISGALPRCILAPEYHVAGGSDEMLSGLKDPGFDPTRQILLESQPRFPQPGRPTSAASRESGNDANASANSDTGKGTVSIKDASTDEFVIEAQLREPAILLITDAYANGWRVVDLAERDKRSYQVLPANLALRAIPLSAGNHLFRMSYEPAGYVVGRAITFVSAAGYALTLIWALRRAATRRDDS